MAVSRVDLKNGETLIDLTKDNVNEGSLVVGHTAHGADGEIIEGTNPYELASTNATVDTQKSLIDQIKAALANKAAGGEGLPTQEKTVDITQNGTTEVLPDDGYALSRVGIAVNVPIPDGYIKPSGTQSINQNGTHDVTQYASVDVAVPDREVILQDIEVTENGTYAAADGYDGIGQVVVNVASGGGAPDPGVQYQRVEYITTAEEGTYPYIITDFYADNDSGVEVIASFAVMQDRIPMGSRQDSGSTRFYCAYPLSTTSCYYGFNIGSAISCSTKVNTIYRLQTNFMNSRQAIIYEANGARKAFATFTQTLGEHPVPVAIFGYNSASSDTVTSKREYKLYGARLSHGFEVVREYIPCYRKSDGVVGLYEKFTGQFLTAVEGAFAKGADIDW